MTEQYKIDVRIKSPGLMKNNGEVTRLIGQIRNEYDVSTDQIKTHEKNFISLFDHGSSIFRPDNRNLPGTPVSDGSYGISRRESDRMGFQ